MSSRRFDIAFLGTSLAARMAAPLLAKQGKSVLLLADRQPGDAWHHSSLHLEKLLGTLGGRDCFASYRPLQVLSARARVTIQPELPLGGELQREFGADGSAVQRLLNDLEHLGAGLEELFWQQGGLPLQNLAGKLRWRWQCQRGKLPAGRLSAPLAPRLDSVSPPAREWLYDLFQGLSLQPVRQLRVADGALLWHHARRPEGIAPREFDLLLGKRFEQFHGVTLPLATVSTLSGNGRDWRCELAGGGHLLAGTLVLGHAHAATASGIALPPILAPQPAASLLTSDLDGQLSPLLAPRVIIGGALPLRMTIDPAGHELRGRLACPGSAETSAVRAQLAPVLPFARYQLDADPAQTPEPPSARQNPALFDLFSLPLSLGNRLFCADESTLLPHLGTPGAALLAWSLVNRLHPASRAHHD